MTDREPEPREPGAPPPASRPPASAEAPPPADAEARRGEPPLPAAAEPPIAPASESVREPESAPAAEPVVAAPGPSAPAPEPAPAPAPSVPAGPRERRRGGPSVLAERPETVVEVPRRALAAGSRRDFLLLAAGVVAAAAGAWWVLPFRTRSRLLPAAARDRLDSLEARVGLTSDRRERVLDGALTFDDDVAEAFYSKDRRVRTYDRSQVTPLRNNYNGQTPGPEYLPNWRLQVSGLASGRVERLGIDRLLRRFPLHDQITRLVCVEGWSAIAWWSGIRFADFLAAFPPAPGARWAALRSAVNLDAQGRPDPYYVSIDFGTARHPQTLLATHYDGLPLTLDHGAPLRLLAPVKLGLKNIKAVTEVAYTASEPPDYWNERGYSKYDGL